MTTSERLAVAYEDAVKALTARAQAAGVADPESFAREFVTALHGNGWRPYAPVTALPRATGRPAEPPHEQLAEVRALLRASRPSQPETQEPA